jgi:hypothetical protein
MSSSYRRKSLAVEFSRRSVAHFTLLGHEAMIAGAMLVGAAIGKTLDNSVEGGLGFSLRVSRGSFAAI